MKIHPAMAPVEGEIVVTKSEPNACAAPDLEYSGETVDGATVHRAFVAALGDGYASLVTSTGSAAD